MRRAAVLLGTLALVLGPLGPAVADPEPDDHLWQAQGPLTSGTITGYLDDHNDWDEDTDVYLVYLAPNTTMTLQPLEMDAQGSLGLRDADGSALNSAILEMVPWQPIRFTTGPTASRYFITISGARHTYRVQLSPESAIVGGPPMPASSVATTEPDDSAGQAFGPLVGDTVYTGGFAKGTDHDWATFWADAPFTLEAQQGSGICRGDVVLRSADVTELQRFTLAYQFKRVSYAPSGLRRFFIEFVPKDACDYRFSVSPASAIKPAPAKQVTPVPAAVSGLKAKRTKRKIIVSWPAVAGATSYQVRAGRKGAWRTVTRTRWSVKRKAVPKKGIKVSVRAVNVTGAGAAGTVRIRR